MTIEQDFDILVEQINKKIAEAAKSMKELNALLKMANMPGLIYGPYVTEDMDDDEADKFDEKLDKLDMDDLVAEIENAGWSTSSSQC